MAHFRKFILKVFNGRPSLGPEEIEIIVKDLDYAVCHLDLALRPLRKAPIEKNVVDSLEMCLKIISTSAILMRTKYCQEPWEDVEVPDPQ